MSEPTMTREQAYRILAVYGFYSALNEYDAAALKARGVKAEFGTTALVELDALGEELDFDSEGIVDDDFPVPEALAVIFGGSDGPQRS